jgi:hypothetical protein
MRFRTSTAAACVLAAGLAAGGCASASSGPPAGPDPSPVITAAPSPSAQAGGNGGICQPQNLTFALSGKATTPGYPGQNRQAVDLTNTGSSACTMTGFPGVDLTGVAKGQQNYTWSLVRQSVHYSRVTLPPGGTAHFTVTYLPQAAGDSGGIAVAKMVITPPGAFTQAELTWNQTVVLQDGATHPGTYISPVAPGP